jgi:hypothetical protein
MASPPPSGTTVSVSATVQFAGQDIVINSGNLTSGLSNLVFSLTSPVALGTFDNFIDALNTDFGVPLTSYEITGVINEIPSSPAVLGDIKSSLLAIVNTPLVITTLNVNAAAGAYAIGVSFPVQIPITSFLSLNGIGVLVSYQSASPA